MTARVDVDVAHRAGGFDLEARFAAGAGITVLFGPSGSGKSLTLALIAGLRRPDRGRIILAGRTVADAAERLHVPTQGRRVGVVFQEGLLLPHRSVLDNVALAVRRPPGADVTRADRDRVAATWLERVGARDLSDARPGTLSGGERQRVALARALAGDPSVLLLDEPFSALDGTTRRQLRALVRDLVGDTGLPTLFVTHDLDEAEELGDDVVLYEPGRTVGAVAPAALRARPAGDR